MTMGGVVKIVVIKPDRKIMVGTDWTGSLNMMFFSKCFCEGNIEKALNNLESNFFGDHVDKSLTPIEYGLTLVDFNRKKIIDLQNYDRQYMIRLTAIPSFLNKIKEMPYLLKEGLIEVIDISNNTKYSIQDFFNTTDTKEILDLINKVINGSILSTGKFAYYNQSTWDNLRLKPAVMDFEIIKYRNDEVSIFFNHLLQDGFKVDAEKWSKFSQEISEPEQAERIKQIKNSFDIHKKLELDLHNNTNDNIKNKMKI